MSTNYISIIFFFLYYCFFFSFSLYPSFSSATCVLRCDVQGICYVAEGAVCEFIEDSNEDTSNENEHERHKRDAHQENAGKGNNPNLRSAIFVLSERCQNTLRCGRKDSNPIKPPTKVNSVITCCLNCLHFYPPCTSISFKKSNAECKLWNFLGLPFNHNTDEMIYYSIKPYVTDCSQIAKTLPRSKSGRYAVAYGRETVLVVCEIKDKEGWTVLQKRQNSSFNFNRTWEEYRRGFGDLRSDFWLGNEFIYKLTSGGKFHLRIEAHTRTGNVFSATYASFKIRQESENYKLSVGDTIGQNDDGGHAFFEASSTSFSTYDRDNDQNKDKNCASEGGGGWWFRLCWNSCYFNGLYTLSSKCDINIEQPQLSRTIMMIKRV
ncbi:uncharacterized protein LOC117118721 [Anneissia japonica]|uniref:uncharacterized protein LOC117118721 n=1 Tax=Anneissia japonica TaxID=1529436 RepID=UPI0014258E37|nr:uncharacterized protein LOC117118721 [Anneissia japonica]